MSGWSHVCDSEMSREIRARESLLDQTRRQDDS